jgi:hypothetical protein
MRGMRMRFGPDDETAFFARREELGEQFAGWLNARGGPGDPNDAGLLMDWKWGYGDGALDRWSVDDVNQFLFDWCPRKLSCTPADAEEIPDSVAAFVEFLADTGLLAAGDTPARIRRHCMGSAVAFVEEMGNPANFGMAKSMLGGFPFPGADPGLAPHLGPIGPVRMPTPSERLASATAAPILTRMRALARFCATPGRALTATGNLRLADARHLVTLLDTGDDAERGVRSAADLTGLAWTVEAAVTAGVVRRHGGKLVAVAAFAGLDDLTAHEKLVSVGFTIRSRPNRRLAAFAPILDALDDVESTYLYRLLDRGAAGAGVDELVALGGPLAMLAALTGSGSRQLDKLADLGLVELTVEEATFCPDCAATHPATGRAVLTAAGIHAAVLLARKAGIEVTIRPDPATAAAAEIVDLIGEIDEEQWRHDIGVWFAAQADGTAAGIELATAATAEHRDPIEVLAGLQALGELAGDRADDAVAPHLGGPHDSLVLGWLLERGAIDPDTVEPIRLARISVDVLAMTLDAMGPSELVALFDGPSAQANVDLLDTIWRIDHPRLAEILDTIGSRHPVKGVAKAARKALVKHRSMLADQRSRRG